VLRHPKGFVFRKKDHGGGGQGGKGPPRDPDCQTRATNLSQWRNGKGEVRGTYNEGNTSRGSLRAEAGRGERGAVTKS